MAYSLQIQLMILTVAALTLACQESLPPAEDFREVKMQQQSKDFRIPSRIWDDITGMNFKEAAEKSIPLVYAPAKIILREKNPGVLTNSRIEITTSKGGADIDIGKYVTGKRGTFYVQFDFEGMGSPETFKSYFVSRSKKRKIDNDVIGSGCKYYFNVAPFMLGANKTEGLKLNTTRDRHISALAGHFIFSYMAGKQIVVSSVSFTDSNKPELFCE